MSIYDEIGGAESVAAAVEDLYRRLLADPDLAPYFAGTDLARLKAHQRAFIAAALGSSQVHARRDMAAAHAGLVITGGTFDSVVGHLVDTLASLDVPDPTIAAIGSVLAPLRGEIVNAP